MVATAAMTRTTVECFRVTQRIPIAFKKQESPDTEASGAATGSLKVIAL